MTTVQASDVSDWSRCHICGGEIIAGDTDLDGRWARAQVTCTQCGATWVQTYFAHSRTGIHAALGLPD